MAVELTASKVAECAKEGFERLKAYRNARVLYIKDYVGQYMSKTAGLTGETPINLVFLAIRTLIPNLVMKEGVNKVTTKILPYKEFAELLGLGLNELQQRIKMKKILRALAVDMCFGLAVAETGIAESGELLPLGDVDVDPGQIYTDIVSFDNLTIDPICTALDKAGFIGHRIVDAPRQKLLDADGWDHDLVKALPSSIMGPIDVSAKDLTQEQTKSLEMRAMQDCVSVVKLWVPEANAICYVPDPYQHISDNFLKIQDYYGPASGPYSFGSLTPPVPDNPLPIAPVGVWRDLSDMANNLFVKLMNQADRQKDMLLYDPALADMAEAIRTGRDGEAIATTNPQGVNVVSFGGQNTDIDRMVNTLSYWFNLVSGNPMQMGGLTSSGKTDTATEFQGLQGNLSIGLNDMRDIMYDLASDISSNQAWFMIHDPLINMPLFTRTTGGRLVQVWLTPEQRRGDWPDYAFEIIKRSMTVADPVLRTKNIMEFYTNVLPAVASAAVQMLQMGIEFNMSRALMQAAEEMGIADSLSEVFRDPEFDKKMMAYMQLGPKGPSKGTLNPAGIQQQGGFVGQRPQLTPGQEFNQQAQQGAAPAQSAMRTV